MTQAPPRGPPPSFITVGIRVKSCILVRGGDTNMQCLTRIELESRAVEFLQPLGSQRPAAVTLAPATCQPVPVNSVFIVTFLICEAAAVTLTSGVAVSITLAMPATQPSPLVQPTFPDTGRLRGWWALPSAAVGDSAGHSVTAQEAFFLFMPCFCR